MDYNYDRNVGRRRVNNPAVTPYSRPIENRYMPSAGRPMVTSQDRHHREQLPNRYGNVLDDIPQQNHCLPEMPQTPARQTFSRPRFQTPFASGITGPGSTQMSVVARTPYSTSCDMDDMMMPIGSPALPKPRYTQYDMGHDMGHFARNTPAPRYERRPVDNGMYGHYTDLNDSSMNSEPCDYNRPVLQTSPHEFSASFSKNTSPRAYGSFLRGAHQFPSPAVQSNQYEEPVGSLNAFMKATPMLANTRQYLNEPMEETVEERNFAKLSLEKDAVEKNSRLAHARSTETLQKPASTAGPVVMSKKVQETGRTVAKKVSDNEFVLSGPIEKILKWDAVLNDNPMILYETIAPLVQIRQGEHPDEKIVLLRDASTPVLQCIFSEVDRRIPCLRPGQLVRCVGKMISTAKMRGFSVRAATEAGKKCNLRMSFIINRVVNDMAKDKKVEAVRE